jgi:hypothetical protein
VRHKGLRHKALPGGMMSDSRVTAGGVTAGGVTAGGGAKRTCGRRTCFAMALYPTIYNDAAVPWKANSYLAPETLLREWKIGYVRRPV